MERIVLHSDLNNFYASVECVKDPSLKEKFVAVCGNREDRHGIVLAKNMKAKKRGVKTGDTIWQAEKKCPGLVVVPPDFESYAKYSKKVREIYYRYTDMVEPFGMDECWLDVTGSTHLFGSGENIAHLIREQVKKETGLTVSIGVSFNKIFSKLGSDLKKPDAVTVIKKENFKEIVWPLSAGELLNVGYSTEKKLNEKGIKTIGDIAKTDVKYLKTWLGKNGETLYEYANGLENSVVMPFGYVYPAKSVGHGITLTKNLVNNEEVRRIILELFQDVSHRLRNIGMNASGIQLSIKDKSLIKKDFSVTFPDATRSSRTLTERAYSLFTEKYNWTSEIRAVSVSATNLVPDNAPQQLSIFNNQQREERFESIEEAMEDIRKTYGKKSIIYASTMLNFKMPKTHGVEITLPSFRK